MVLLQSDGGFLSAVEWAGEFFLGIIRPILRLVFQVSWLETEAMFPFGRPVAPELGGQTDPLSEGFLPVLAREAYDWVWLSEGGELTWFALILLGVLSAVGGFFQYFKWYPLEKNDLLVGFPVLFFWFPIYYGTVAVVHRLTLLVPLDPSSMTTFIIAAVSNGYIIPYGWPFVKIGLLMFGIMAFLMWVRMVVIVLYLLFGPILIAITYANIPGFSAGAKDLLKLSLPVAVFPFPMISMLWFLQFVFFDSGTVSASDLFAGIGINPGTYYLASSTGLVFFGSLIFALLGVVSLYMVKLTFDYSDKMFSTIDSTLRRTAGAAGVYATTGDSDKALRAMKMGPGGAMSGSFGGGGGGGETVSGGDDSGGRGGGGGGGGSGGT